MSNRNPKSFLILSQFFWPEHFRVNELADKLSKHYKLEVITSIPNYPEGKFYDGYGLNKKREDLQNNINITRVLTYPRKNGSSLNLFLNYLTFNIFSFFKLLKIKNNIDCVFIPATSPLTQALAAILLKKKLNFKVLIWIQDIFPESFYLKKKFLKNFSFFFDKIAKFILNNCDQIYLQNLEMENYVTRYTNKKKEILYLSNWTEDIFISPKNKVDNSECNIVMAGNIGEAQGINELIEKLADLKNLLNNQKKIFKIHVIGDGVKKNLLIKKVKDFNLDKYFIFYGRLSPKETSVAFKKCNFGLSIYSSKQLFLESIIPSRFISYIASNLLVITNSLGAQKALIDKNNCGYANKNIISLFEYALNISEDELNIKISNSQNLFNNQYNKKKIFNNFLDNLQRFL